MTKEIGLTQGYVALVDDEDYDELNKYKWYAVHLNKGVYARRNKRITGKQYQTPVSMHRHILGLVHYDGKIVDHINRNELDNRRENLRVVDYVGNTRNHNDYSNNRSGCNGVYWDKDKSKWRVLIGLNGKQTHLGYYKEFDNAVEARKQGELKYW